MTHIEIREKFLKFFEARGHKIVPSSSLLPTDPSVLFTTAGMQQFKPYYTGEADPMKDFGSLNTASIQKSMRTSDIDEVGDESHLTFFEMLGNFSFGGYWKKEAIEYAHEFITKVMGLKIDYVSVFKGEDNVPADEESEKIWKSVDPNIEVKKFGRAENFWGPTGDEGPCGPTSEIYVNGVEIWNLVFNEYYCTNGSKLEPLKTLGIDTGMGLERLAMALQGTPTIFETDLFASLVEQIPGEDKKVKRIIADHLRASVHLIADGVGPGNKDRGYVLRRLLRRAIFHAVNLASAQVAVPLDSRGQEGWNERTYSIIHTVARKAIEISFFEIVPKEKFIISTIDGEMGRFLDLLKSNSELHKVIGDYRALNKKNITGEDAFKLFSTFGLPVDYIRDEARRSGLEVDLDAFEVARGKHQEKSRAGAEKKFGGHGLILDTGELKAGNEEELKKATRLHTATHLLHASLRKILGSEVKQAGSDITAERLRFDFTFPRKMTPEEIKKVETLVNEAIQKDYPVTKQEMPYEEAIKSGALAFFKLKYPPTVNVYTVGPDDSPSTTQKDSGVVLDKPFSRELCGGPHVTNTGAIGSFKITKEESISAGTRRIRAIVE